MQLAIRQPFSFAQTLAFVANFPPSRDTCVIGASSLTTVVAVGGRSHAYTLRDAGRHLELTFEGTPCAAIQSVIAEHARHLISADDDLGPLYEAARGDGALCGLVRELHGLHHVRFPTLADSVVYSILMQRAPMPTAAALKRKFLLAFGHPAAIDDRTLHAMPELDVVATLGEDAIATAIRHRPKAARIAHVAREVAQLGELFLKTAPYASARDALLAIRGIGPFAAAAILLRGLGRMNELPWMPHFERAAQELYGERISAAAITRRYGNHIGYWSFYVKAGLGRRSRATM